MRACCGIAHSSRAHRSAAARRNAHLPAAASRHIAAARYLRRHSPVDPYSPPNPLHAVRRECALKLLAEPYANFNLLKTGTIHS
ncbi:jg18375 [Pararge aegeria aegeria]|uniref:Jg18375 protein n=1 Tax=Pararge aegeria aegeria TaxID=348720 RepID=A0A8S4QWF7_9NEOP|nr:jg18375 [Pararge aegeria aegeria]